MLKLTVIADTHHYSKRLGTTGRQYELRSGSDQKCLAETGKIIEAAFKLIASYDSDYVLIAGDLTNDGEMLSHWEFRRKLEALGRKKKICVITATHDWCNDLNARRFIGDNVYNDVITMKSNELSRFYGMYGLNDAHSKFLTHIGTCSYSYLLNDKVMLLALNDDKNEHNHAGFTPEHFKWIEEQLRWARENGYLVIGMEHHLLMPHISPLVTGGACVANHEYVASRLADAGLEFMFVGHSHIQSIAQFKSAKGNVLTEFNVGSLVGYPAPMLNITIDEEKGTLDYFLQYLEYFQVKGKRADGQLFLRKHALAIIHRVLESADKEEFGERLTALQLNGELLKKFYPIIKPVLELIRLGTVRQLYNKMRLLGLSRFVDKSLVDKFADERVISFVDRVMLMLFDGGKNPLERYDDYYRLVMSVVSIPSKLFKKSKEAVMLAQAVDAILTGGQFNNQSGRFEFKRSLCTAAEDNEQQTDN